MKLDKQSLLRVLKWAHVCEGESRMNSADYALLAQIAVQVDNPTMAEEAARNRLLALEHEQRLGVKT